MNISICKHCQFIHVVLSKWIENSNRMDRPTPDIEGKGMHTILQKVEINPYCDTRKCKRCIFDEMSNRDQSCTKSYPGVSYGGYGYLFLWFCPMHGHLYGLHLVARREGRKDPSSLFKFAPSKECLRCLWRASPANLIHGISCPFPRNSTSRN